MIFLERVSGVGFLHSCLSHEIKESFVRSFSHGREKETHSEVGGLLLLEPLHCWELVISHCLYAAHHYSL